MDPWAAITALAGGLLGYMLGQQGGVENGRRTVYEALLIQLESIRVYTGVEAESWAKMPAEDACRLIGSLIQMRFTEAEARQEPAEEG